MTKKNILITGGAGFIGSSLTRFHLEQGNAVWVVDNLITGRKENLQDFQSNPSFRFDQEDMIEWPKLHEAVEWADNIYNMAAVVGQRQVLSAPVNTLTMNIRCCEVVLQAMSSLNKKGRLLVASSSEVYRHTPQDLDKPFREDSILPISSGHMLQETYPLSKIVNEIMGLAYAFEKGIHCTIARLFNTIGLNQTGRYGMVVPTFVDQALNQKPLTVYGDGHQTRSFCNVKDTAKLFDLLLENPESNQEIVNVGNDQECSILDLAKLVRKIANSNSEIKFLSYREAYGVDFVDHQRRRPNIEKLIKLTGYSPKWSLEQTLKEIIENASKKIRETSHRG